MKLSLIDEAGRTPLKEYSQPILKTRGKAKFVGTFKTMLRASGQTLPSIMHTSRSS